MRDLSCVCCICTASESLSSLDSDDENNLKFLKKLTLCLPKEVTLHLRQPELYKLTKILISDMETTLPNLSSVYNTTRHHLSFYTVLYR